jgi:YidC/Oxa1 family membrane protein insertase
MPFSVFQPLQTLVDAFEEVLLFFHGSVGLSWGFSIIALTVVVRALLVPLAIKQAKSMRGMQLIAPEIKALQEKYKGDKQRLNQEMMEMYKRHQVNPFGSCLPLIAQMPVFISLFYLLREDLKTDICGPSIPAGANLVDVECGTVAPGSADFFFIPDLTAAATGGVLVALILMYIGSQLLSSLLMMNVTADKTQRYIMLALPFVFTVFILNFPAGLIVYWITTNLWTVGQQYIIRKTIAPPVKPLPGQEQGLGALIRQAMGKEDPAPAPAPAGNGGTARRGGKADAGSTVAVGASGDGGAERAAGSSGAGSRRAGPPPQSPRKKKRKTGRRR